MNAMTPRDRPSTSPINFWPALLDVVTAAFMVFVLSTYLQLVMAIEVSESADAEAEKVRKLEAEFVSQLDGALGEDLSAGHLEVVQVLGFVRIRFSDRVLFDSGDYKLKDSGMQLLDRFGRFLASAWRPGVHRVLVEGHTDDVQFVGSQLARYPTNNWELSSARATVVTLFLLDLPVGLPTELFSANGYSSNRPIADNRDASGRARNRRVEIELVFAGQEHQ